MQWKYYRISLYLILLSGCVMGAWVDPGTSVEAPEGYKLVFSDEFNGPALDTNKWAVGINRQNIQNDDVDCVYRMENISFRDGYLVFTQRAEPVPVRGRTFGSPKEGRLFDYSSGGISTAGKFSFKNNMYIEVHARMPGNNGGYGAFWTMPQVDVGIAPADLLEIDIFEYIANPAKERFWSGIWWHDYRKKELSRFLPEESFGQRLPDHFFVYDPAHKASWQVDVKPDSREYNCREFFTSGFRTVGGRMEWILAKDGPAWSAEPYAVFKGGTVVSRACQKGEAPSDQWKRNVPSKLNERIILNFSLHSEEWSGGPIRDDQLPAEMLVDYVRVYELAE